MGQIPTDADDELTTSGADDPGADDPGASSPEPTPYGQPVLRTGAEQPWDPEDLAVAKGQDPTPENVARSREELRRDGPAAIEKTVP